MSDYATTTTVAWPARKRRPGPKRATSWREDAHAAITAAIVVGKALGLEGRKLELHVSRTGYPFGARGNHPYKVWLDEFHRILHGYRGPFSDRARKRRRELAAAPGQLTLFE
jgi:hypothetical protein